MQNLALVASKTGDHKESVKHASKAIAINEKALKALYLRSQAYDKLNQFDEALDDIKACIRLAPNEKLYRDFFEKVKENRKTKASST